MKPKSEQYYLEFKESLKSLTDQELIDAFNKEVGIDAWVTMRASYLAAMHSEFVRRGYDFSDIGDESSLSFKNKIKLEDKKVNLI